MVTGVISLSGFLLDHDAFRVTGTAGGLPIDIVFPITATRKPAFSVLKSPTPDVAGKRPSISLLDLRQQVIGLWRCNLLNRLLRSGGALFPRYR